MKTWKAGYTVEASLIVPLILWVFGFAMHMGITLYEEVKGQMNMTFELWEVEEFYKYQSVGEFVND